jgi:tRNA (mo5U34)-methyltransferase
MNATALMSHPSSNTAGLAEGADELAPWFHNLHLPDGSQTAPQHPLGDFPNFKWMDIAPHIPADLSGWTALDIGCNAGFYAIELARRGAHVVALDKDEHFLRQARWARERYAFGDRIEVRQGQVYDLASTQESFDLVVFMGVFYHLRYPLLGLDVVARRVKRLMIFQTLTLPGDKVVEVPDDLPFSQRAAMQQEGWPKMAFIEKELAGDWTNWWAPNHACIEAMLRSTGMRVTARPGHEMYLCEPTGQEPDLDEEELLAATGQLNQQRVVGPQT